MDIEREQQLIDAMKELEKEFEQTKRKRAVKTWLFLSVAIYIIAIWLGDMKTWVDYLAWVPCAPVCSIIYLYINIFIFTPMIEGARREAVILERLHTELNLLRRE